MSYNVQTFEERLDNEYKDVVKKYQSFKERKTIASFVASKVPEVLYEQATRTYVYHYNNGKMEFTIYLPFSKKTIRETYKLLRQAGWVKKSTHDWDTTLEIDFIYPGTDYVLEVKFDLGTKAATCVKVPKKVKKVMTESEQVLESEIICSEEYPELFEEDEDGNMKYIGEVNPEVVVE